MADAIAAVLNAIGLASEHATEALDAVVALLSGL